MLSELLLLPRAGNRAGRMPAQIAEKTVDTSSWDLVELGTNPFYRD